MRTAHSYIKAAWKGNNGVGLYIATIVLILVFVILAQLPLVPVFQNNLEAMQSLDFASVDFPESAGLALLLFPFAVGFFVVIFGVRYIHQRNGWSIFNALNKMDWKRFGVGFGLWFGIALIFEGIAYFINPEIYSFTFDAKRFFPVLLVAIVLIPLQASFEEVLFRGYLMQGFGTWLRRPWAALLITSVAFGGLHFMNPEVKEFGNWIITYYIAVGILLGLISLMDEGLELAMGMHSANNIFGAVVVTFPSSVFSTPALITLSEYDAVMMFVLWIFMAIILYVICSRMYKWGSMRKLVERVGKDEEGTEAVAST